MKLQANRKQIAKAMSVASRGCADKSSIPITQALHFEIIGDGCTITGTDFNIQVQTRCTVISEKDFSFCVEQSQITRLVNALSSEDIKIEVIPVEGAAKFKVQLKAGKGRKAYTSPWINPKEFKVKGIDGDSPEITMNSIDFTNAINAAQSFVDSNDMREAQHSINIFPKENCIEIYGAHSGAITKQRVDCVGALSEPILFRTALVQALGDVDSGELKLSFDEKWIKVSTPSIKTMIIRSIGKPFPVDYIMNKFIEKGYVELDAKEFTETVIRMGIFKSSEKDVSAIAIDIDGREMTLNTSDFFKDSTAKEVIDIENNDVDNFKIGIQTKYLQMALSHISSEKIYIFMEAHNKPIVIKESLEAHTLWMIIPVAL